MIVTKAATYTKCVFGKVRQRHGGRRSIQVETQEALVHILLIGSSTGENASRTRTIDG
jgi:hypothetical protein